MVSYSFERIGKLLEERGLRGEVSAENTAAWCLPVERDTLTILE